MIIRRRERGRGRTNEGMFGDVGSERGRMVTIRVKGEKRIRKEREKGKRWNAMDIGKRGRKIMDERGTEREFSLIE